MECLLAAITSLSILGSFWLCGSFARGLRHLPLEPGEKTALRLLAGAGFLGLGLFLAGQFYFAPKLCVCILLLGSLSVFSPLFRTDVMAAIRVFGASWAGRFCFALLTILFVAGMAEPVGSMGHDGISYHLLGPKVWLRDGRVNVLLDHFHTSFPATIEMLYGVVMAAAGPRAPGALGVVFAGLFLIQVHGMGRAFGGLPAGRLAMVAVASVPVVTGLVTQSFVDLPFAAFALAAIRVGLMARSLDQFLLAGGFLGFCAGTKYTGLLTLALTLPVLAARLDRANGRRLCLTVLGVGLTAILLASPWYLRNWFFLGTPIYPPPILQRVFHPRGMPPESVAAFLRYIHDERGRGMGQSAVDFVLLPFRLTYFTSRFHGAGGIGLIPLGFGCLGVWVCRNQAIARLTVAWAVLLTVIWFVTQQEARFLIHVIAVAIIFGSVGATVALRSGRLVRGATLLLILISIFYGTIFLLREHAVQVRAVMSPSWAAERHNMMIPYVKAFAYLNHSVEVRSVLILDAEVPPYYMERPYVKPMGAHGVYPFPQIHSPRDAVREARNLGVTHLLDVSNPPGSLWGESHGFTVRPDDGFPLVFATEDARVYSTR